VLVLLDAPSFPGCLVTVRLIGGIRARQRRSIRSLPESQRQEIEHFFFAYNHAQGRELKVTSQFGAATAQELLSDAIRTYERQQKR
jgi:inorganic pyrophosphatase